MKKLRVCLQSELADLTDEEKLKRIREIAEHGSLSEWWNQMRANQELRRAS
jgi:hypothetical protein